MSFENIKQSNAVSYLLRTTQQHHVSLSMMADQKANIVIAASSILLTFSFANFKQQNLFWGFLALFVFSFFSLIAAIMAVNPRFRANRKVKIDPKNFNPLFFGHFTTLSLNEYNKVMEKVMKNDKETYETQVKDIYQIGSVLKNRKYKYLSASYRFFLIGVVTAALLFALQTVLFYFT